VLVTIILFGLLAAVPIPPALGPAWAEFSRAPACCLTGTKVEVGTLGFDRDQKRLDFWLRRTVTRGIKKNVVISWADTRTCAAARPLLASIRDIPVPKFAPVGTSNRSSVYIDGISFALRTYSDEGTLTAETNVDTPLASWIDSALKKLDSCWSDKLPERTR